MSSETLSGLVINTDYLTLQDEKILKEKQEQEKISLLEGAKIAYNEEQYLPLVLRTFGKEELIPDYNFKFTEETFNEVTDGVDEKYWDSFGSATSLAQAHQIKRRILDTQENNEKLATLGYAGIGLRVAASILDVPAALVTSATLGAAAPFVYSSKISRLSQYVRSGLVGAGTSGLITAPFIAEDPTRQLNEIGYNMLFGGLVGTALTRFLAPKHPAIIKSEAIAQQYGKSLERFNLENDGYQITEKGNKYFKQPKLFDQNKNTDEFDDLAKEQKNFIFSNKKQYATDQATAIKTISNLIEGDDVLQSVFERIDKTPNVAFSAIRFDKSSVLRTSPNPAMRTFAEKMAEEAVGNRDYSPSILTTDIFKNNYFQTKLIKFYKGYRPALDEYLDSKKVFIKSASINNISDFSEMVGRSIRGEVIDEPGVRKAAQHSRTFLKEMLDDFKKQGIAGAADILDNQNYFPRSWMVSKIVKISEKIKEENVIKFLKNSLIKGSRNLSDEDGFLLAKHILRMVKTTRYGDNLSIDRILKTTDESELRKILKDYTKLTDSEVNNLSRILLKPQKGNIPARFKRRASFDETHNEVINGINIKFSDFLDNNAEGVIGSYLHQMSGHAAFASINIKSSSDFAKVLNVISQSYDIPEVAKMYNSVLGKAKKERELRVLDTIYKNILGIPTDSDINSTFAVVLRNVRKYNYVNLFNQVGFAQLPELGNVIGEAGFIAFAKHIPEWKKLLTRAKDGKLSNELLDEIETLISGTGSNRLTDSVLNRTDDFAGASSRVGTFEKIADIGSRITTDASGFHLVDAFSRRLATVISFNKLARHATGELKLEAKDIRRYKNIGFTDDDLQAVFKSIREKSSFIEGGLTGRKIRRLNVDDWDDQDLVNRMSLYMARHLKRVVQENNYGEAIGFLRLPDSSLGKSLIQFRGFVTNAYAKQLLHGLHMRDFNFFAKFMVGSFIAGLGYVAQTYLNAQGKGSQEKDKFLEEKLDPLAIAKATFQRNTYSTIIPPLFDTLAYTSGFDPLFNYRTTGLDSNIWDGNPSISLIKQIGESTRGVGKSLFDEEYDFSKKDAYSILRILPYQNLLGVKNVLQYMVDESDLPERSE